MARQEEDHALETSEVVVVHRPGVFAALTPKGVVASRLSPSVPQAPPSQGLRVSSCMNVYEVKNTDSLFSMHIYENTITLRTSAVRVVLERCSTQFHVFF